MLKKIIKLGRFQFALPVFMVFSCGTLLALLAGESFYLTKFIFGYMIFFSAQLSVQYGNEYFDYDADRMTIPTFFSGGSKVLRNNKNLKIFSKLISISLLIISIILSVLFVLIFESSVWIIILAVLANLLGWFYSAPPLKLSYRGLGEITIMLIIGIILPIAVFIMIDRFYRFDINFILLGLVSIPSLVASFYGSIANPSERRKIVAFVN